MHYNFRSSNSSQLGYNLYIYVDVDWARPKWQNINIRLCSFLWVQSSELVVKKATSCSSPHWSRDKSVANVLAELIWVRNLLNELSIIILNTPTIFCDNVGVTCHCHNPVFNSRMKHIAVDFCYIRNQVQAHQVLVRHTYASDQLANTVTKPLPKAAFARCCSKLDVVAPYLTWGGVCLFGWTSKK